MPVQEADMPCMVHLFGVIYTQPAVVGAGAGADIGGGVQLSKGCNGDGRGGGGGGGYLRGSGRFRDGGILSLDSFSGCLLAKQNIHLRVQSLA